MRLPKAATLPLALSLAALGWTLPATAQTPATLVADGVRIEAGSVLVAQGNVEVLQGTTRLRATQVTYDRSKGALNITGPITLTDDRGTVVLADSAALSDDLRQGLLTSASMVLDRQLQIAAAQIERIDDRQTVLRRAVASSCQVCATNPTPLWEIRAASIRHDEVEQQIYFDNAQLRVAGLPVFWLPHLRMPGPGVARAKGFLMPRLLSTSRLGVGIEMPYFLPLGETRDLTFTPVATTKGTRSLGLRYRQAFTSGELTLEGAYSRDDVLEGRRGWLGAWGRFDLPQDYELTFSGVMLSDPAYFRDYGLSDEDRLYSRLNIQRTLADEFSGFRLVHTHSIRAGEENSTLPQLTADLNWIRRFQPAHIGGTATLEFGLHGHHRAAPMALDGSGRDVMRGSLQGFWRRDWLIPSTGMIAGVELGAAMDFHHILQDPTHPTAVETFTPMVLTELRWPWSRKGQDGTVDILEPVVQVVWSRAHSGRLPPNEDSLLVEFDPGNLFGFNRFAGIDRRESGARINAGLQWTRLAANGWTYGGSMGRVIRLSQQTGQFTAPSGLEGDTSDWLATVHLASPDGLHFQGRAVFDDTLTFSRNEMRFGLERPNYGLNAGWLWSQADPEEFRFENTSEWEFDGRLGLTDAWTALAAARYDFRAGDATTAALGLQFVNECLRVGLTVERKLTSSRNLAPSTDLSLAVDLLGFGQSKGRPASGTCGS